LRALWPAKRHARYPTGGGPSERRLPRDVARLVHSHQSPGHGPNRPAAIVHVTCETVSRETCPNRPAAAVVFRDARLAPPVSTRSGATASTPLTRLAVNWSAVEDLAVRYRLQKVSPLGKSGPWPRGTSTRGADLPRPGCRTPARSVGNRGEQRGKMSSMILSRHFPGLAPAAAASMPNPSCRSTVVAIQRRL